MRHLRALLALPALLMVGQLPASADELLINGNLNSTVQVGDPTLYYPEFTGWTFATNPCSYSPCPIAPYVPGGSYTQYSGYPAGFADRLAPGDPGAHGLIGTAFEGHYPFEIVGPVDIEISQTVAGTPGQIYDFSGWAHFQGGYAGGVEFLDGLGVVLPGSILWELHNDGGQQNDNEQDGIDWVKHVLSAQAPAGTVNVRVRAGMIDGEFNVDAPHQNVFFDDFSLTTKAVPEPATLTLTGLGFALAAVARRRRR